MLLILKNTDYHVTKNAKSWTVRIYREKVSVTINIPFEVCPDEDSLKEYLNQNCEV